MEIYFGITSPYQKGIKPFWCGYYARQARQLVCEEYNEEWKTLFKWGFRVVKVEIQQHKPPATKAKGDL